ncbi:MAG: GNAT family N-acetyltransferase [Bacillota bacterium]
MIIRTARKGDLKRIVEISNAYESQQITVEKLVEMMERPSEDQQRTQLVAVGDNGDILGFASIVRYHWQPPGQVVSWLAVDADQQNQGVGSALHHSACQAAVKMGGTRISSYVRDDLPASLRFALDRGYRQVRHVYESVLILDQYDPSLYQAPVEAVKRSGIELLTLTEIEVDEELRRQHYDLFVRLCADIPGEGDDPCLPYQQYRAMLFDSPSYRPDLQVVALAGRQLIGMATSLYRPQRNELYSYMTGVDQDYRRRGIGLALKAYSLSLAKEAGISQVSTHNSSLNQPMVELSSRLGYRPRPGLLSLELDL